MDALKEKAAIPEVPKRPPNSFTIANLCERYNVSEWTARNWVRKMRRDGDAQLIGNGRTAYYVLVQKRLNSETCTKASK